MSTKNWNRRGKSSKWWLPVHERYAAVHFAYQYPKWKRELEALSDTAKAITYSDMPKGNIDPDPTFNLVARREQLMRKTDLVERCAREAEKTLYSWILLAVTDDSMSYDTLRQRGIPCGQRMFYDRIRKFYFLLSEHL